MRTGTPVRENPAFSFSRFPPNENPGLHYPSAPEIANLKTCDLTLYSLAPKQKIFLLFSIAVHIQ
jgi:hypothetical protein